MEEVGLLPLPLPLPLPLISQMLRQYKSLGMLSLSMKNSRELILATQPLTQIPLWFVGAPTNLYNVSSAAIFLIPYCISLLLIGVPMFFMELSLGQFTSSGPLSCWKMAPAFQGTFVCERLASEIQINSLTFMTNQLGRLKNNLVIFCAGLGAAMLVITAILAVYYNMIIGWAIYYMIASFTMIHKKQLPWTECHSEWATKCE